MKEAAAKYWINLNLTAVNSPWSNEKNERNHYTVDTTVQKLMEEHPSMKLEDALSKALYAHNLQINWLGCSPRQLVFGHTWYCQWISSRFWPHHWIWRSQAAVCTHVSIDISTVMNSKIYSSVVWIVAQMKAWVETL